MVLRLICLVRIGTAWQYCDFLLPRGPPLCPVLFCNLASHRSRDQVASRTDLQQTKLLLLLLVKCFCPSTAKGPKYMKAEMLLV